MTKAWGIWAGFMWTSEKKRADTAMAPHTDSRELLSRRRRMAPRKTSSSVKGASRPMAI